MERSSPLAALSDRELETLAHLAEGLSNDAIAHRLMVSTKTIESMTASVFRKLNLDDSGDANRRVQAAVLYVRHAPDVSGATSLPIRTTSFVGRRTELDELQHQLERHRCLTISGPGGAGKTTLALALAATWAGEGRRLRYVDLVKVRRPDLVAEELIAAFGVVARDTKVGLRRVKSYIGAEEFLVVFDNADEVGAGTAEMADSLLLLPRVRIVTTSRHPIWSSHEHVWIAPPMTLHDSERLLRERCEVAIDEPTCRRICVALDGLPLAIELVASRLATVAVDFVVDGLGAALPHVLTSGGDGRHASLRRALLPSYEDLPDRARRSLQTLALLPAGFIREDARSILAPAGLTSDLDDLDDLDDVDDLDVLTRASLLTFDGARYRMLEPIRQFTLSLVHPDAWPQIVEHHARHWIRWAKRIGSGVLAVDPSASYAALSAEQSNVEAVVRTMLDHGAVDGALRIMTGLAYPWSVSGGVRPLDLALQVLDACDETIGHRSKGRALTTIGGLGSLLASPARDWEAMLTEAIGLLKPGHDDATLAAAYYALSRHRLSLDGVDDAIQLSARTGQHWLHGWSLVNKASLLIERSCEATEALEVLDRAEQVGRQHGLPVVVAGALMRRVSLAILEAHAGRSVATRDDRCRWADEAERIMRASGDLWQIHEVVFLQCRNRLHDGDLGSATRGLAAEAISVAARCGSGPILAEAILLAAEIAERSNDAAHADELVALAASVTSVIWNRRWVKTHAPRLVARLDQTMGRGNPRSDHDVVEQIALDLLLPAAG